MRHRLETTIGAAVTGSGSAPSMRSARGSCAGMRSGSAQVQLHHSRQRRPDPAGEAAHRRGGDRRSPPAARALFPPFERWKDRGLTPDRVPADEAAMVADGAGRELYQQYAQRLIVPQRRRLRRSPAAQPHALSPSTPTCWRTTSGASATSWWTNTRTPTSRSILCCGSWPRHRNLCCVGDDDQSVYSGAAPSREHPPLREDFPGARHRTAGTELRSTPHILAAAAGPHRPQ